MFGNTFFVHNLKILKIVSCLLIVWYHALIKWHEDISANVSWIFCRILVFNIPREHLIACVWAPIVESTNFFEWFTVLWL